MTSEKHVPVSVLMVCTGNICRSPAAERLARELWGGPDEVRVSSGGLRAMVGESINLSMNHLLLVDQVDTSDFTSRQLAEGHLAEAELILTMTRRQRGRAVATLPSAIHRTFTLAEFAQLASDAASELSPGSPGERLRALIDVAHAFRRPGLAESSDIVDPYGEGTDVYEQAYADIRRAVETVARALHAVGGT